MGANDPAAALAWANALPNTDGTLRDAALVKLGAGSLVLSGTNTYSPRGVLQFNGGSLSTAVSDHSVLLSVVLAPLDPFDADVVTSFEGNPSPDGAVMISNESLTLVGPVDAVSGGILTISMGPYYYAGADRIGGITPFDVSGATSIALAPDRICCLPATPEPLGTVGGLPELNYSTWLTPHDRLSWDSTQSIETTTHAPLLLNSLNLKPVFVERPEADAGTE